MKKFYLFLTCISISATAFSQQKQAQFQGAYLQDPNAIQEIDTRGGTTIWSEDFAGGLPLDWGVSTTSGPVDWKHTMVGHMGDYPTAPLSSSTSANGWMIVDSDNDNFSGGGVENSRLISPEIDLTGFSNVKLEFQQMFRRWQSDITTVQVSVDSINWTNYVINSTVTQAGTANPDYVNLDISAIAGNQATVWISFLWQGEWDYGWQIDDIAIKEILDNDITMKNNRFGTAVEYFMVPSNQVQPFEFSSDVENIGMLSQTNITLDVTVNDGTTNVYTGSSAALASLAPWVTDSIGIASGFTPAGVGNYEITFEMNQAEVDEAASNNTRVKNMQVTDTVYALDNGIYQGQWYNLESSANNSDPYFIGGVYDIYTTDVASSISAFIGTNSEVGAVVTYRLFAYDGTDWYEIGYTLDGDITAGDLGNWKTMRLTQGIQLDAGSFYAAMVDHIGGPEYLYIGYSSNTNPGYTVSSDGDAVFAGQPRCAMVRLNMGSAVGIEEEQMIANSVYPNPATDCLNIQLNNLTNVNAELIDITGKVVISSVLNNNAEMNVSEIARGVYTLRLTHESSIQTLQVVLTK